MREKKPKGTIFSCRHCIGSGVSASVLLPRQAYLLPLLLFAIIALQLMFASIL